MPACTHDDSACAGVGLRGPVADSPAAARDAFLRQAFHDDPSASYPEWKRVRGNRDRVTFRAPRSTPSTDAQAVQLGQISVTHIANGWTATDNC